MPLLFLLPLEGVNVFSVVEGSGVFSVVESNGSVAFVVVVVVDLVSILNGL